MDSETGHDNSISPPAPTFSVGQIVFEKFEVEAMLGFGNMGHVYKVRDRNLDKLLALKVLNEHSRDEKSLVRFQNEAKMTSRLNHPAIATIYDFGQSQDGSPYLASEFIDGQTLEAVINERGKMALSVAVPIFFQVADALDCAHRNGVVHCDIKPGNIMLSKSEDGAVVVKVVDFGIARIVDDTVGGVAVSMPGRILGTPRYMSPEQTNGEKATERSDLYSLGCVIYECLAGVAPFECETTVQMLFSHQSAIPRSLKELDAVDSTQAISDVLDKLLSKRPSDRFQSAAALKDALSSVIEHLESLSLPPVEAPSAKVDPSPWRSAPSISMVGAVLLALVVVISIVVLSFDNNVAQHLTVDDEKPPDHSPILSDIKAKMDGGEKSFSFRQYIVNDEDLGVFSNYQRLEALDLNGQESITDKGLEYLRNLKNLKRLGLVRTAVRKLPSISSLTALEELELQASDVDDDGIKNLSNLNKLRMLDLRGTDVTGVGLNAVATLPRLNQVLFTTNGEIGFEKIYSVWHAHPGCKWLLKENVISSIPVSLRLAVDQKDRVEVLRQSKVLIDLLERRKPINLDMLVFHLWVEGDTYLNLKKIDQARLTFEKALAIAKQSKTPELTFLPLAGLFTLESVGTDVTAAEAAFKRLKPILERMDNRSLRDVQGLAMVVCCQRNRKWDKALFYWDELLKDDPDNKKVQGARHKARYLIYLELKKPDVAYDELLKSIVAFEMSDRDESTRLELQVAYLYASEYNWLRKHYQKALEFNDKGLRLARVGQLHEFESFFNLRIAILDALNRAGESKAVRARLAAMKKQAYETENRKAR